MIEGRSLSRRALLKYAGGAVALAGTATWAGKVLIPEARAAAAADAPPNLFLAGTDGWMFLPKTPAIPPFHPDTLAPDPFTTYIFGFRNVTGLSDVQRSNQKNKAQHSAPLFWVDQFNPASPVDFKVQLTNLGLALRPDLFDAHTLHWHGFRNVIPFFDGEPTGSVAVPTGRVFTYVYRPRDPGTYMYHCHVEDVEHVHMGMNGLVFVRPTMGPKFVYNDAIDRLRPRVRDVPLRGVGGVALGRRAHPVAGVERLPGRLQPAQRASLPGHAAAERADQRGGIHARARGRDERRRRPCRSARTPGAAVPAPLVARDLQCRREGCSQVRQPRVPGAGDEAGGDPDARGRPRRHTDAGP